ncbi:MAG: DUF4255 domain-containing protein [Anaerolineae bacterium]|nr:DUF4255 domain-containing protein [Anaerolineae bacterium]
MINDLDEVLRQLLIQELSIHNGEVDISFEQPSREWAARVGGRPTLNVFLYDVRENKKLRQTRPPWDVIPNADGTVTQRRKPVRVDLHYMITAWASDPQDEHRLLTSSLMALFRQPHLPLRLLPESLQDQPVPVPLEVAQYDELHNPADIWNVLDNEMRAAVALTVTLALDPYQPVVGPLVRTRELRFGQSAAPALQQLYERAGMDTYWTIGGSIRVGGEPLKEGSISVVEQGRDVRLQPGGRFAIGHLRSGEYTLEVAVDGGAPRRFKIAVPAPDYVLEI